MTTRVSSAVGCPCAGEYRIYNETAGTESDHYVTQVDGIPPGFGFGRESTGLTWAAPVQTATSYVSQGPGTPGRHHCRDGSGSPQRRVRAVREHGNKRTLTREDAARRAYHRELVKVLLVSFYWPPAGGGGVQRPLKLAQYLPALGFETHVLAPDDPRWVHADPDVRVPSEAWVHRVRYVDPPGGSRRRSSPARKASSARRPRHGCSAAACSSPTRTCPGT